MDKERRKTHWCAWDQILKCKDQGGLSFRDLRIFNQALLAKQAWRLIQFPDSLCARIIKAKYYQNGHILDTMFPSNASLQQGGVLNMGLNY